MLAIFTSMSLKRARKTTCGVLDQFAPRIGADVWQANLTEAAIETVRKALRRSASKDTSVACFCLRTRHSLQLQWIVGNRRHFSPEGHVAVASTSAGRFSYTDSCSMEFLPVMRPLVQLAALLHDIGKSNKEFQTFLGNRAKPDSIRHEWLSGLLFAVFVNRAGKTDKEWLQALQNGHIQLKDLPDGIGGLGKHPFRNLPPAASALLWLIISHHRLPSLSGSEKDKNGGDNDYMDMERLSHVPGMPEMLRKLRSGWGYEKADFQDGKLPSSFLLGPLEKSESYTGALRSAASELERQLPLLEKILKLPALRLALIYCRAALMLGDYECSSRRLDKENFPTERKKGVPYANTRRYTAPDGTEQSTLNQTLEEHLLGVEKAARRAISFSHFVINGNRAYDSHILSHRSPRMFEWQDKAADKFCEACEAEDALPELRPGCFIVNMASTGCGKTIANAKIMRALSKDGSLRFSVLFNLKSLTLQTGDVYRDQLGLTEDDCTVSIGSRAMKELHERDRSRGDEENWWKGDSLYPSAGGFYPQWIDEETTDDEEDSEPTKDRESDTAANDKSPIAVLFRDRPDAGREFRARLETPIFIAPIDYMMPATDSCTGGHYLLPLLRMMSSDIILDEVDDYSPDDLLAVSRLVHLAGCFGRNVVLSSATMPPGLVRGLAKAYAQGYGIYQSFFQTERPLVFGWCDEFHAAAVRVPDGGAESLRKFEKEHKAFVGRRVRGLAKKNIVRKAKIWPVAEEAVLTHDCGAYLRGYLDASLWLHEHHKIQYGSTGKSYSIGCIRVSHITFCAILMHYLAHADVPDDTEIRLLIYHSNQTTLLRHEEEQYLDSVLHRRKKPGQAELPNSQDMRDIIERSDKKNMLFILIATPVEEVGRDHDFDWAVIEPSSYRSVIQMAGRILRHRQPSASVTEPNIAIMELSHKGFKEPDSDKAIFCRPGPEIDRRHVLDTHDAEKLISTAELDRVDSTPRIEEPEKIDDRNSFVGLEHRVSQEFAGRWEHAADAIDGWTSPDSFFFLSGFVQELHPFRDQSGREIDIYPRHVSGTVGTYDLCSVEDDSRQILHGQLDDDPLTEIPENRLWLKRSFSDSLERLAEEKIESGDLTASSQTGELTDEDWWRLERKYGVIPSWLQYEDGNHASDDFGLFHADDRTRREWFIFEGANKK